MDTLTLARLVQDEQGPYEVTVSYGGEADLHRHLKSCPKNPGHQNFVPIDDFNENHLPPDCRDNLILSVVRAIADLTVRVTVERVSQERPEFFPDSDKPFPQYKNRGTEFTRVGTGLVFDATIKPNNNCTCCQCLKSPAPQKGECAIWIATSAHVVFDDLEGTYTTCYLFFDRGNTPETCSGVVTLKGMSTAGGNTQLDISFLEYRTHDQSLIKRLQKLIKSKEQLYESVKRTYFNTRKLLYSTRLQQILIYLKHMFTRSGKLPVSFKFVGQENLTIIVSHPHGCSKQVSVGYCITDLEPKDNDSVFINHVYSTATCPGSSGAFVLILWRLLNNIHFSKYEQRELGEIHRGVLEGSKELNYGSVCPIFNMQRFHF